MALNNQHWWLQNHHSISLSTQTLYYIRYLGNLLIGACNNFTLINWATFIKFNLNCRSNTKKILCTGKIRQFLGTFASLLSTHFFFCSTPSTFCSHRLHQTFTTSLIHASFTSTYTNEKRSIMRRVVYVSKGRWETHKHFFVFILTNFNSSFINILSSLHRVIIQSPFRYVLRSPNRHIYHQFSHV